VYQASGAARAAAAAGIPFTLAMGALDLMEEVSEKCPDARKWFQLYPWADEEGSPTKWSRVRAIWVGGSGRYD